MVRGILPPRRKADGLSRSEREHTCLKKNSRAAHARSSWRGPYLHALSRDELGKPLYGLLHLSVEFFFAGLILVADRSHYKSWFAVAANRSFRDERATFVRDGRKALNAVYKANSGE